ncbi:MAG: transposase [Flavobacteriaceae bacterium]|nr:transposase [Flavobacteriaceae bacterium]
MPHGYSIELRARALAALDKGMSRKKVAEVFNISTRTLYNWCKRRIETGDLHIRSRPTIRSHRKLTPEILSQYLEKHPDAYLKEIGEALGVSGTAVFKAFKKFGISRKKNDPIFRARREKETKVSSRN